MELHEYATYVIQPLIAVAVTAASSVLYINLDFLYRDSYYVIGFWLHITLSISNNYWFASTPQRLQASGVARVLRVPVQRHAM